MSRNTLLAAYLIVGILMTSVMCQSNKSHSSSNYHDASTKEQSVTSVATHAPSSTDAKNKTDTNETKNTDTQQKQDASNGLVLFEDQGVFGYKNHAGEVVIPAQFQMAMDFTDGGIAPVVDEQGWAYIDAQGVVKIRPFPFDNGPDYFVEGLARFIEGDKIGFMNEQGDTIIAASYDFAQPFNQGFSIVCNGCESIPEGEHSTMQGGTWGAINKQGEIVIPLEYDNAHSVPVDSL